MGVYGAGRACIVNTDGVRYSRLKSPYMPACLIDPIPTNHNQPIRLYPYKLITARYMRFTVYPYNYPNRPINAFTCLVIALYTQPPATIQKGYNQR